MTITDLSQRRPPERTLEAKDIVFGKTFAPNLFLCEHLDGQWQNPRIEPLRSFSIHPAALVLHYAQSIFEGLKAYRQADGSVALFRPELNARRLNASAERMGMPAVPEDLFLSAISELTRVEEAYVIPEPGSLYLRPVMIGTEALLGVRSSNEFLFYVMAMPSGAYFSGVHGGPGAVRVLISKSVVRAAKGGTGAIKTAANYAVTLKVIADAKSFDCAQVLFLDATPEQRVEEMGGMNIMFVENGTLVTPPLSGTLLPGVTRDSILKLAVDLGIRVQEEAYPLVDLLAKLKNGSIQEAFACGTAATITGIDNFKTEDGQAFVLPAPGPITQQLYDRLIAIHYGHSPDQHHWLRPVVEAHALVS